MEKLNRAFNNLLKKTGHQLVKSETIYTDHVIESDENFLDIYSLAKDYTMTSKFRCYSLYKSVEFIIKKQIPGALVECGVWKGGNGIIMCETLKRLGDTSRDIYLYDTYEGMVEPGKFDNQLKSGENALFRWKKMMRKDRNDWCYASQDEVRNTLEATGYPKERIKIVKGKVEDTLPKVQPAEISILRLDTDWYESTKCELEILYPKLIAGGLLIIDDYGSWAGSKKAVDEYFSESPLLLHRIDAGSRISHKI
jgi:hypothetical protein